MKHLKKLSRENLKGITGGKLPSNNGGVGCTDACTPGNGVCEKYGLSCGMWVTTGPDGSITMACLKCL